MGPDNSTAPGRPGSSATARSRLRRRLIALLVALGSPALAACSPRPDCGTLDVRTGEQARVVAGAPSHPIDEAFFGFNLELTEFQLSFWNPATRQVFPALVAALEPFAGAVYRFPGGTTANHFDPALALGAPASRKSARIVDWTTLDRIDFGFAEYAAFVRAVGGRAWYVLNLYGTLGQEQPLATLGTMARQAVRAFADAGLAPLRYELGNELDRADVKWPSARYVEHARAIADAVRSVDRDARFTGMLTDYDSQADRGITASQYNRAVLGALDNLPVAGWAQHLYYDGPPEGPPLPNRLAHLCRTIRDIEQTGGGRPEVWVTEHARWPQADAGQPWKSSWRRSADFDAALGTADFVIALSQSPAVKGGMLHALHATGGPWPLLHADEGSRASAPDRPGPAPLRPSVVFDAYRMFRETLLPQVLSSTTTSPKTSGYGGGYDVRASVLRDPNSTRYAVWAVNRAARPVPLRVQSGALANRHASVRANVLASADGEASNHAHRRLAPVRAPVAALRFDGDGAAVLELPARSIVAATIELEPERRAAP